MNWISKSIPKSKYVSIHIWLKTHYGKANKCEHCTDPSKTFEYALKKGEEYKKDRNCFIMLCKKCHAKYDNNLEFYKYRNEDAMNRIQEAKYIAIDQFDKNGNFLKTWRSAKDVQNELNILTTSINNNLKGISKHAGGFIWKYSIG